jgi:FixJ family two-component response regulator
LTAFIHIVDDDEAVRDSLQILLEACGFAVRSYPGGAEFLKAYRDTPRTCLLLDINMPVMGGLAVLEQVRRLWPRLPVILITGRSDNLDRAQALASGAFDLLDKPFRDSDLLGTIERALASA